ncbi:hypothetical protein [Profundibacterium mesophilum]|uniref:Uncharacterized protein n=1 Tax=Profundibacterium mesophilum KAUST100406-0324 TaxID=1037889 RepID=A0A921NR00_9RHOB|nr:hypothetical protein [Profundibacterium mesophilum]KAF0677346.1 hypothetical protein PMES_00257 [Profundibacterium mesophilum KAUST100406-0324]
MTRSLFALSLGFGLAAVAAQDVFAEPRRACAKRPVVLEALSARFGKARQSIALVNGGMVMEIFAGPRGTWTATITRPDGTTCIIAAGTAYERVDEEPVPHGAPA